LTASCFGVRHVGPRELDLGEPSGRRISPRPACDIFTGLRQGEKLREALYSAAGGRLWRHPPLITQAHLGSPPPQDLATLLGRLELDLHPLVTSSAADPIPIRPDRLTSKQMRRSGF
jgi:hypothetical protein